MHAKNREQRDATMAYKNSQANRKAPARTLVSAMCAVEPPMSPARGALSSRRFLQREVRCRATNFSSARCAVEPPISPARGALSSRRFLQREVRCRAANFSSARCAVEPPISPARGAMRWIGDLRDETCSNERSRTVTDAWSESATKSITTQNKCECCELFVHALSCPHFPPSQRALNFDDHACAQSLLVKEPSHTRVTRRQNVIFFCTIASPLRPLAGSRSHPGDSQKHADTG